MELNSMILITTTLTPSCRGEKGSGGEGGGVCSPTLDIRKKGIPRWTYRARYCLHHNMSVDKFQPKNDFHYYLIQLFLMEII